MFYKAFLSKTSKRFYFLLYHSFSYFLIKELHL